MLVSGKLAETLLLGEGYELLRTSKLNQQSVEDVDNQET